MEIWIFGLGGYSVLSDLDLGKKVGNLDFWDGGVFCNFGFGLRKKSWKFGFLGWGGGGVFCNFGFGLGNLDFLGGYSVTSDLDLKKVGNLDFWGGGVFCNFGFGLGFLGCGGVFCNFGT